MSELPKRAPRVAPETAIQIVRLDIRQVPRAEIARRVGVSRTTVSRVLERSNAALQVVRDTDEERERAIQVYLEVQRSCWEAIEVCQQRGRSPAMLLAEVRMAQQAIDKLLGLAPAGPDDPVAILAAFKATVVSVIQAEAPDLAPQIAQRLLQTEQQAGRLSDTLDVRTDKGERP